MWVFRAHALPMLVTHAGAIGDKASHQPEPAGGWRTRIEPVQQPDPGLRTWVCAGVRVDVLPKPHMGCVCKRGAEGAAHERQADGRPARRGASIRLFVPIHKQMQREPGRLSEQ